MKLTVQFASENRPKRPQKEMKSETTINFQVRAVGFREGSPIKKVIIRTFSALITTSFPSHLGKRHRIRLLIHPLTSQKKRLVKNPGSPKTIQLSSCNDLNIYIYNISFHVISCDIHENSCKFMWYSQLVNCFTGGGHVSSNFSPRIADEISLSGAGICLPWQDGRYELLLLGIIPTETTRGVKKIVPLRSWLTYNLSCSKLIWASGVCLYNHPSILVTLWPSEHIFMWMLMPMGL